jgi:hypothetical protein
MVSVMSFKKPNLVGVNCDGLKISLSNVPLSGSDLKKLSALYDEETFPEEFVLFMEKYSRRKTEHYALIVISRRDSDESGRLWREVDLTVYLSLDFPLGIPEGALKVSAFFELGLFSGGPYVFNIDSRFRFPQKDYLCLFGFPSAVTAPPGFSGGVTEVRGLRVNTKISEDSEISQIIDMPDDDYIRVNTFFDEELPLNGDIAKGVLERAARLSNTFIRKQREAARRG